MANPRLERSAVSGSPGTERRGTTQLGRFQLAPIKKLEGSLKIHFLLSSLFSRMTFPGGAGGGEAGSRPLPRTWAGILMPRLSSAGGGRHGPARSGEGLGEGSLRSAPPEAQIRQPSAGAAQILMKTSPRCWQGAPDAPPGFSWERMGAARRHLKRGAVCAQHQRLSPGRGIH
ncbi:hypothetical protein H1C71_025692, partial [Ictidomys tridecemlineatus]